MPTWHRGQRPGLAYGIHQQPLTRLNAGDSVLRVLFGIKADGFWTNPGTATQLELQSSMNNLTAFGIVTTIGNGAEAVPSPIGQPDDVAPPTQRWLFNAASTMSLTSFSGTSSTWTMGFRANWESNQSEGMVLATGLPAGDTLGVWLSIDTTSGPWATPSAGDIAWYTIWWSLLTKL